MPHERTADEPASREVVLVLRIRLDRHGRLRYGELLDAGAITWGTFVDLTGMTTLIGRWLERQPAPPRRAQRSNGAPETGGS